MRYKRILIWEVNWIGDVLFSMPFIKALRETFPEAHIACIAEPRCKEILEVNPSINEVILYDGKTVQKGILKKLQLIALLRKKKFDVVFLLHRSLTRTLICFLSGVKQRIGYSYRKRDFLLTHKLKAPLTAQHRIERFVGLARKIGADTRYAGLEFYMTDKDTAYIEQFLRNNGVTKKDRLVAINPGGNWNPKRWIVAKYAELADILIKKLGVKVIVTGAEKDVDLYLAIQEIMDEKLLSACGKTTLRQLGALFQKCDLVISGDSGPLHIALALKKKAIALFGPTSPSVTGPYGDGDYVVLQKDLGCEIPCYNVKCNTQRCMDAIKVDELVLQVERMLHQGAKKKEAK